MRDAAGSGAWFQNTEFRSCAPCAQLAHSMCSCHHAPSPRSHQTNVTSGSIRTRERFSCSITTFLAVLRCESGEVPRRISSSAFSRRVAEPRRYWSREPRRRAARPHHLYSSFSCFDKKRESLFRMTLTVIRRRPTLPGRFQPSTISVLRLNFCVRDGNRWIPQAIVTGNFFEVRRSRSLPLGCSRTLKTAQVRVIPPA